MARYRQHVFLARTQERTLPERARIKCGSVGARLEFPRNEARPFEHTVRNVELKVAMRRYIDAVKTNDRGSVLNPP